MLADAGYDVWLGNARGNVYSRQNNRMSPSHPDFWRFSWHEIGVIDIPTMIDFITAATGQQQIHYVGHSQGTTVYFVMLSERPEYNAKIKTGHLLAPCAFFGKARLPLIKLSAPLVLTPIIKLAENKEFLSKTLLTSAIVRELCDVLPLICRAANRLLAEFDITGLNMVSKIKIIINKICFLKGKQRS